MPKWIDHIVVRVKDLNQSLEDYETKLGMKASKGPDAIPDLGMTRAIVPLGDEGRFIELAEPLGEGGAIGPAGAIANAIRSATGQRLRSLPFTPDAIRDAALKST